MTDYLTTNAAAEILNISRRRVLALIKAGRLPAQQFGNAWLIKPQDLELVRERKPGRPAQNKPE